MLSETEKQSAARIQNKLRDRLQATESATDLTPRGRDRLRARAILEAQAAMRAIREQSDTRTQSAFQHAYKEAFGISLTQSAEDRAIRAELAAAAASGELGATEAQQKMADALAIGDSLVARALSQIAFEHRNDSMGADAWTAVSEAWGGSAPAVDRVLSAVYEVGSPSKIDQFRDKAATEIIIPSDLRGSLEAIAAEDDTAEGTRGAGGAGLAGAFGA